MKPFFSIVIPCCDVEPYVEECLQSVLSQPFQDWECLICIETSKDKTEEVIREKTAGDPRFRFFTGPRTGSCSESRNIGIDNAQGEYIIFLDGDDTIADGCLERLHEKICARPGADLYPCTIVAYTEGTDEREIRENYPPESCPEEMTGIKATLFTESRPVYSCPMLQLTVFRREFLVEHGLKCIRGLRRQDSEFSPRALYLAKRVVPLHEPYYLYRIRENSVSTAAVKKGAGHFLKDWAIILKSLIDFHFKVSREPGYDRSISRLWARRWLELLCYFWFDRKNIKSIPRSQRLETLKPVFSDGFDAFSALLKNASRSKRIAGWWIKLFISCPSMRWAVEQYFLLYSGLAHLRSRKTQNQDQR